MPSVSRETASEIALEGLTEVLGETIPVVMKNLQAAGVATGSES